MGFAGTRGVWLGALLGLVLAAGCRAPRVYVSTPGPYDRIPEEWRQELRLVRLSFENGDLRRAHERLWTLAVSRPEVLPVRLMLQDLQLARLGTGRDLDGDVPEGADTEETLADVYRQRAEVQPTTIELVLAARLVTDGEEALELLDKALALDPGCVWVHYGAAFWNARLRRFPEARAAIERAFRLDSGHLPTMRLHASLLARAGDTVGALDVLELWLERSEGDPLVDPARREEAKVDLAALHVIDSDPRGALRALEELDRGRLADPARADLVEAVAFADLGRRGEALAAAQSAKALAPESILALVHQALLFAAEGDAAGERSTWELLLREADERRADEASTGPPPDSEAGAGAGEPAPLDFADLLLELRAHARLERIERAERAELARTGSGIEP